MKAHYETYRYTDELRRLKAQSIVECRLPGSEITSVLVVQASVTPAECACADGEVRYGGKLTLGVVYEDGERNICRAERGAEFFHKASDPSVTPACFARALLRAENVMTRREGTGLYVSVVVGAELPVYGTAKMDYLTDGEGLIVRKNTTTVVGVSSVSGETEREDEFDADYVGDILLHGEKAIVTSAVADGGQIDIDGEMTLNVCAMKSDKTLCSYERLIPFRMQIPSEEAFGNLPVSARVTVKSARVTAGTDEEKGKSKIVLSTVLSADCVLYKKDEVPTADDAFSGDVEIALKKQNGVGRYLTNTVKYTERISGSAIVDGEIDEGCTLAAAVLPRAELSCVRNDRGETEAEGVVQAELFFKTADGAHKKATLSLPVAFPIDGDPSETQAECLVYGLNVKRRKNGETEAEGTLKVVVRNYEKISSEYISEVIEGETYEEETQGVSIFLPREGEDLWQVAKRLKKSPEELQRSNPKLTFPVKKGERIVVCRGFGENL